jgi:RNA polymerase sigma-70 factor (ECF subfamily)
MIGSGLMSRAGEMDQLRWTKFEDFYSSTWQEVYRTLAVVIRDSDLAREATDEAMVRGYQRWNLVQRYDSPTGWVYRVALNWARSRMRKMRRVENRTVDEHVDPETPADPVIERALASLPQHQREVVVLHYLFDMSGPQIASQLGIKEGTVRSRLNRALASLREELPDDL